MTLGAISWAMGLAWRRADEFASEMLDAQQLFYPLCHSRGTQQQYHPPAQEDLGCELDSLPRMDHTTIRVTSHVTELIRATGTAVKVPGDDGRPARRD